jgi:lipopolysaccharide transport system ATP-binding protein
LQTSSKGERVESIVVQNLTKRYVLGSGQMMFREMIMNALRPRARVEPSVLLALNDVSFTIGRGELVGIIGRNGAGKSTLLKVLSRITYPTRGTVHVNGRVGSLLEVGTGFHEELSGRENVYLNGAILGMKKREIDRKLDEIVEFADVDRFIDTPIKRYSSGMRMRLGFSVAAHLDTDILFVDEVLAVGDVGFQRKCLGAMSDLKTQGRTVLFVSHNMSAVEHLCPRAIWIEAGRVHEDGPSSRVLRNYMGTYAGSERTSLDLTTVTNRRGSGAVQYRSVAFLGDDEAPLDLIRSGDRFRVRLGYEVLEKVVSPIFGFQLFSASGVFLTDVSTWNLGVEIPVLHPGQGHLDLRIDSLNLMPGRYFLSLWLTSPGDTRHDVLEHVAALDVEPSNYYKSGRGIDSRFGIVVLPCRWDLSGLEQTPSYAT